MLTNDSGSRDRKWIYCFGFLLLLRVGVFNPPAWSDYWRLWELDQSIKNVAVLGLPGIQKRQASGTVYSKCQLDRHRCFSWGLLFVLTHEVEEAVEVLYQSMNKVNTFNTFLEEGVLMQNREKLMALPNVRSRSLDRLFYKQLQTYCIQRQYRYSGTIYPASGGYVAVFLMWFESGIWYLAGLEDHVFRAFVDRIQMLFTVAYLSGLAMEVLRSGGRLSVEVLGWLVAVVVVLWQEAEEAVMW